MGSRVKTSAKDPHAVVNVDLAAGDWIDVMDNEGTWNVAQVLSIPSHTQVEVKYDGWGPEYNEILPINSERVAPYHTYTWSVKCWAKYKNWPWWPSIVTIRPPGNVEGQKYLETETKLFVDFLDGKDITKRCRCWVERSKITPFSERHDERRKRTTGTDFENSYAMVLESQASSKFPSLIKGGTLPVEFKTEIATPVRAMRKEQGMQKWAIAFNTSRVRHRGVYRYKSADQADDHGDAEEDDDPVVQFEPLSDEDDDRGKKSRPKGKGKAPVRIKSEKTSPRGKNPGAKKRQTEELSEQVVLVEDSAQIIEGPHAPNPKKEPQEEQPLFLSPFEDLAGGDGPTGSDEEASQPVRPASKTAQSNADTVVSRKRKAREPVEPSDTASPSEPPARPSTVRPVQSNAETIVSRKRKSPELSPAKPRDATTGESVGDTQESERDASTKLSTTTPDENPEEATLASLGAGESDDAVDDGFDHALIEDIDENDDDDYESDVIPLDAVDEIDTTPSSDSAGQAKPSTVSVDATPSAQGPAVVVTKEPIAMHATEAHQNPPVSDVADAVDDVPLRGALASLKKVSDSLSKVLSPTIQEEKTKAKPARSSNRKPSKSLADVRIAQAQAALAELEATPVPPKKRRTEDPGALSGASSSKSSPAKEQGSGKPRESPSETPNSTTEHEEHDNALDKDSDRDMRRRSSMRAGSKDTEENTKGGKQGKPPVWVLPPPKFDSTSSNSPSPPWEVALKPRTPALPRPFSSLSLFGSTVDFSMTKWFKRDKYPHCLAQ